MRHVITLIALPTVKLMQEETALINHLRAVLNPVRVCALSDCALDFEMDNAPADALWAYVCRLTNDECIDAVLQPLDGRQKQLLISDMDSTMIAQECIDELADAVGMKQHVAAITERAMNGELDFKDALRERVALLKDLPISELERTYRERIVPMSGAQTLLATLNARGVHTVLVSGGFTFFTSRVAQALGFAVQEANTLNIANGKLTGTVAEPILDKEAKLATLKHIASEKHIALSRTLAVGDGANDLPMLLASGLGVAYHAKPVVEAQSRASIRHNDLTALLYLQGIAKADWRFS